MEFVPSRSEGQLMTAAIRVLSHREKRPPTPQEIAELLRLSQEITLHVLRGLEARGIVRSMTTPFEVRVTIEDESGVAELPVVSTGPDMGHEIEDFHRKAEDRQKRIERMMRDADPEKASREKVSKMEEEFRRFRKDRRASSPFPAPHEDDG